MSGTRSWRSGAPRGAVAARDYGAPLPANLPSGMPESLGLLHPAWNRHVSSAPSSRHLPGAEISPPELAVAVDARFPSRVENGALRFDGGDIGAAERSHRTVVHLQGKPINVGHHVVKGGARLRVSRAELRLILRLRHASWLHLSGFPSQDVPGYLSKLRS